VRLLSEDEIYSHQKRKRLDSEGKYSVANSACDGLENVHTCLRVNIRDFGVLFGFERI